MDLETITISGIVWGDFDNAQNFWIISVGLLSCVILEKREKEMGVFEFSYACVKNL